LEQDKNTWDIVVRPKSNLYNLNLKELLRYKDLILLLVKRDLVAVYKQTILGPIWMLMQPVFTTMVYLFTFSATAKISTDGIPPILFYLTGQVFWNYFSDCFVKTSNTFIANASVFGKVYFPRLAVPVSIVISNLLKLGIQVCLLVVVFIYYSNIGEVALNISYLYLIPFLIILLGLIGLSFGILFSSITTKYRDFTFIVGFGVQLAMFASCVVIPLSFYNQSTQQLFLFNPLCSIFEAIKFCLTGHGYFNWLQLLYSLLFGVISFLFAIIIFNRTEKSFMDTV
jgi:lipopolysaccharide transport system permease protein